MNHDLPNTAWRRVVVLASAATLWLGCSFDPAADVTFSNNDSPWELVDADGNDPVEREPAIDTRLPDHSSDMSLSDLADVPDSRDTGEDPGDASDPGDQGSGDMDSQDMDSHDMDSRDMEQPDADEPDLSGPIRVCNGATVDTTTSTAHCGACDNGCDPQFGLCEASSCECYDPYDPCGPDNECTLLDADPKNCGQCGVECGVGELCDDGDCKCQPGLTRCNGECVDTQIDPRHCGDCNDNCDDKCRDGSCTERITCGAFRLSCDIAGSGTACVQSGPNALYCNSRIGDSCGSVCDSAEVCYRQGVFEPYQCREFRPAIGCTSCPCDDCDDFCQESTRVDDLVFCIAD